MSHREKMDGCWILLDEQQQETNMYTQCLADVYIEETTNKQYTRGPIKVFFERKKKLNLPPLIENTGGFKFYKKPAQKQYGKLSALEEIYVSTLLDNIFKK